MGFLAGFCTLLIIYFVYIIKSENTNAALAIGISGIMITLFLFTYFRNMIIKSLPFSDTFPYLLIGLSLYFIISIRYVAKYFSFHRELEKEKFNTKAVQTNLDFEKKQHQKTKQEHQKTKLEKDRLLIQLEEQKEEYGKLLFQFASQKAIEENNRRTASENVEMRKQISELKNTIALLEHQGISAARELTFGPLLQAHGSAKYDADEIDISVITFPTLIPSSVYFLKSGHRFHSVPWCYTLDQPKNILTTTLKNAKEKGLQPCSKCVEPAQYEDWCDFL